jgi:hypothetical protein
MGYFGILFVRLGLPTLAACCDRGGAGDSDADFHGEAVVPEGWIRQNWSGFLVLEVMPPHGDADRVVVIAKKGIRASTAFFTFRMTT